MAAVRKRRKNPRLLVVARGGGWGFVVYVGKRAYHWGHHSPMKPADSRMTAMITAFGEEGPRDLDSDTPGPGDYHLY